VEEKTSTEAIAAIETKDMPVWVDRETALRHCPVSYTTLWRISKQRSSGIRTTRVGRRVFFDLISIQAFMEKNADGKSE
jgi:hypothetical protein